MIDYTFGWIQGVRQLTLINKLIRQLTID